AKQDTRQDAPQHVAATPTDRPPQPRPQSPQLSLSHRLPNLPRLPLPRCLHKRCKERPGRRARIKGSLRMPLHRDHELISRSLDRLDYAVFDTSRHNRQSIAGMIERLVMAAVYREFRMTGNLRNAGAFCHRNPMRLAHLAPGLVIDPGLEVLNQRSAPPHIPRLKAVTDP